MIAFHVGPAGKSRRLTRWLHFPDQSLQQVVAVRDQLCLDEILRLRQERLLKATHDLIFNTWAISDVITAGVLVALVQRVQLELLRARGALWL